VKTVLFWIIIAPLALVALVFLISNRAFVPLDLWPLPFVLNPPLSIVILASVFIGFITGGFVAWISAGEARQKARINARRIKILERELDRMSFDDEEITSLRDNDNSLKALAPPSSLNAA
jgi:uncharacterized integral membrane protein